ncbi:mitochondrial nucleoid-associated protein 1 isoform X2 [Notamacropus eugenii]|uniref:mitochondrial nucleoid-associated protein 1 isoform X2 n=1 Tax=Notamacropus eugenii TaxID=9315 RepID=UPI003B66C365
MGPGSENTQTPAQPPSRIPAAQGLPRAVGFRTGRSSRSLYILGKPRPREMADILPEMELCPNCKKQFKRLKSHLPYCKKVRASLPFNSDITHSNAVLFQAPKSKELQKELAKADDEETRKKSQSKRRNTNLMKVRLHSAELETRTDMQTSEDVKKQIKITPHPKRVVFLAENGHMLSAAKKYSKAKLTKSLPKLGQDKSKNPSEILGTSPSKQSSTNEDKKHFSSLLSDFRIEHPGQKLLTETLDLPFSIYESFPSLDRSQNPYATLQSDERGLKAKNPISGALHTVNNSETQRRITGSLFAANYVNSSLYKILQTGGMENRHIKHRAKKKEFHFGLEAAGKGSWNKGFEGNKSPEVEISKSNYMRDGPRKQVNNNDLATERKRHHDNLNSPLLPSRKLAHEEALSLADLGNQSLSALVLKYLQEEEGGYKAPVIPAKPVENKKPVSLEPDPEPKTWATQSDCHLLPLNLTWHCAPKNLTSGHVEATGNKSLPTSLGLEWFPELYPGYLHLGMLAGRPQKGNIELQKPHHDIPEESSFLKAPHLERSLRDVKIGKLSSWLTISNFSLVGLLGKVQKAWIKYPKYISLKKGSAGGITMLFAGYWVLCYSWSFKHLSKTSGFWA